MSSGQHTSSCSTVSRSINSPWRGTTVTPSSSTVRPLWLQSWSWLRGSLLTSKHSTGSRQGVPNWGNNTSPTTASYSSATNTLRCCTRIFLRTTSEVRPATPFFTDWGGGVVSYLDKKYPRSTRGYLIHSRRLVILYSQHDVLRLQPALRRARLVLLHLQRLLLPLLWQLLLSGALLQLRLLGRERRLLFRGQN